MKRGRSGRDGQHRRLRRATGAQGFGDPRIRQAEDVATNRYSLGRTLFSGSWSRILDLIV